MTARLMALVLFLLLPMAPCTAGIVQWRQTQAFDFDNLTWIVHASEPVPVPLPLPHQQTATLQFAAFDPSLGTLQQAYLSYEGDYALAFIIAAGVDPGYMSDVGGTVVGNGTVNYQFGLTATGIDGERALHKGTFSPNVSGYRISPVFYLKGGGTGPGESGTYPLVHAGNIDTPLLSLADGLDVLGPTVDVDLDQQTQAFLWLSNFVAPSFSYIAITRNEWSGQVALTYTYDDGQPAAAPVPGSLLLLGAGLLALGAQRRR